MNLLIAVFYWIQATILEFLVAFRLQTLVTL